jgi:hypothetical protein
MKADNPFKIEIQLNGRPANLSFDRNFIIREDEVEFIHWKNRKIVQPTISTETYNDFIEIFKKATLQSVSLVDHYFEEEKDEVEPLLSAEFYNYGVEVDVTSFNPNMNGESEFMLEFNLFFECLDAGDNIIFMYDIRGCCCIEVKVSHTKEILTTIDWDF